MEHRWVHSSACASIPPFAVVGGHDCDRSVIYVGRAHHEGDNLPAKVIPSKGCAYVCWGGNEISKSHYEVLTGQNYRWVPCSGGAVPTNAVLAGNTSIGEPLYIGRGHYEGSLTVGKIHPSHHCLYIPFGGNERRLDSYEVLIYEMPHGWVVGQLHQTPANAVLGGYDTDRTPIYVGRAHHEGHNWLPQSVQESVPPHAVSGGHDSDGSPIYVGRAYHEGDTLVAKVIPSRRECYVSWRGQEIGKVHVEVLCGQNYSWRPCYNHVIPPNAVECGRTKAGLPVIVGRGLFEGSLTVGKIMSVHRALFIPYGGCERRLESYEVLVREEPPTPWISCVGSSVPSNAVYAGHDTDMSTIYVGRAYHEGNLLPAKVIPSRSCAYVCNGGREIVKHDYEILTGIGYRWMAAATGYIPPGAVEGGRTVSGEPLFIGRTQYCGSLTPGKIQKSHGCLYIPFAGRERSANQYEVLVNDLSTTATVYPTAPPPYSGTGHYHQQHHLYPPPPPPYDYGCEFKVKF